MSSGSSTIARMFRRKSQQVFQEQPDTKESCETMQGTEKRQDTISADTIKPRVSQGAVVVEKDSNESRIAFHDVEMHKLQNLVTQYGLDKIKLEDTVIEISNELRHKDDQHQQQIEELRAMIMDLRSSIPRIRQGQREKEEEKVVSDANTLPIDGKDDTELYSPATEEKVEAKVVEPESPTVTFRENAKLVAIVDNISPHHRTYLEVKSSIEKLEQEKGTFKAVFADYREAQDSLRKRAFLVYGSYDDLKAFLDIEYPKLRMRTIREEEDLIRDFERRFPFILQ